MFDSLLVFTIHIYQKTLSPLLGKFGVHCRFYPSCSEYAIKAIEKHGWKKGVQMAYDRLNRCNPHNRESCIDFPQKE